MEVKNQWPNVFSSSMFIAIAIIFVTWQPITWWRIAGAVLLFVLGVGGVIVGVKVRRERGRGLQ